MTTPTQQQPVDVAALRSDGPVSRSGDGRAQTRGGWMLMHGGLIAMIGMLALGAGPVLLALGLGAGLFAGGAGLRALGKRRATRTARTVTRTTRTTGPRGKLWGTGSLRGTGTGSRSLGRAGIPGLGRRASSGGGTPKAGKLAGLRAKLPSALGGTRGKSAVPGTGRNGPRLGGGSSGAGSGGGGRLSGLRAKLPRALGGTRGKGGSSGAGTGRAGSAGGSAGGLGGRLRAKLPRALGGTRGKGGSSGGSGSSNGSGAGLTGRIGRSPLGRLFGDDTTTGKRRTRRSLPWRKHRKVKDGDVGADDVLLDADGRPIIGADGKPLHAQRNQLGSVIRDAVTGEPIPRETPLNPGSAPDAGSPSKGSSIVSITKKSKASAPNLGASVGNGAQVPTAGGATNTGGGPLTALAEELAAKMPQVNAGTLSSRRRAAADLQGVLTTLGKAVTQTGRNLGHGWKDDGIESALAQIGRSLSSGADSVGEAQILWARKTAEHHDHVDNPTNHGENSRKGFDVTQQD
ncbi:MAG: hypothetical protein ACRDTZ_07635 [Pseudonocardiaceae bacterium]